MQLHTVLICRQYVHLVEYQITWMKNVSRFWNYSQAKWVFPFQFSVLSDTKVFSVLFFFRWGRQRHRKRRLSRSPKSREWAEPGGHRRRGLDAPRLKASEGRLLVLIRQPPREPQKEKEQKQTQVHIHDTRQSVSVQFSLSFSLVML